MFPTHDHCTHAKGPGSLKPGYRSVIFTPISPRDHPHLLDSLRISTTKESLKWKEVRSGLGGMGKEAEVKEFLGLQAPGAFPPRMGRECGLR